MSEGRRLQPGDAMAFMLAGNAHVTLRSVKTGQRFTYKIQTPEELRPGQKPVHFVRVLTGQDNEGDYSYLGTIFDQQYFRLSAKSRITQDAPSYQAFNFVFSRLANRIPLPETVEVWHEGRCGRCGRLLTVPESIERGLGPECAQRKE